MLAWLRALILGESMILRALAGLARSVDRIEIIVSENQDRIDALADAVANATADIRGDIADLKSQIGSGTPAEELDFSRLDASVKALDELDAENPAPATDPGTPVDGTEPAGDGGLGVDGDQDVNPAAPVEPESMRP